MHSRRDQQEFSGSSGSETPVLPSPQQGSAGNDSMPKGRGRGSPPASNDRWKILGIQIAIVLAFLAAWQWIPEIPAAREATRFLDPFFISSPTRVAGRIADLATGASGSVSMWGYIWATLSASLLGTLIGSVAGSFLGLLLSNSPFIARVVEPFVVVANAVPRIAIIPIIVVIIGIGFTTAVVVSVGIVFFVMFFSALEAGRSVPQQLLDNARVGGATDWQVMRHVRYPYVLAWTFASLPLALTFSLLTVVTTEILTGMKGVGSLIVSATATADATLTFASVVILSILGLLIVGLSELARRHLVRWRTD